MNLLASTAWTLLALESVLVIVWTLFAVKNVGHETQERVMTVLFIGVAVAVIGLAGGLLSYGQSRQSTLSAWLGFFIAAIPGMLLVGCLGREASIKYRAVHRAESSDRAGWFKETVLTAMGVAINRNDVAGLQSLVRVRPPDWTARDREGRTLLGHAIQRAITNYSNVTDLAALRVLTEAGARIGTNDLNSRRPFMLKILSCSNHSAVALLELVVQAGGDPNATDAEGEPLIHLMECSLPKLEIITRHGANLQALSRREDRLGWTALMTAVATSEWDKAFFLIEHGVSADYRAPDGKTARSLLLEVSERAKASGGNLDAPYLKFAKRLNEESP